jgi:hypothetical protein
MGLFLSRALVTSMGTAATVDGRTALIRDKSSARAASNNKQNMRFSKINFPKYDGILLLQSKLRAKRTEGPISATLLGHGERVHTSVEDLGKRTRNC